MTRGSNTMPSDKKASIAAAEHWERLARESEDQARWDREHGIDLSQPGGAAGDHQARMFRRTAEALRLEAKTGRPHCSLCLGDHPNHQHPHRG